MRSWKIRSGLLTIEAGRPLIMGVVNVTPDSFSDGGMYRSANDAVRRIRELAAQGADIIDLGGQSTRPGFSPISAQEEWSRLAPVFEALGGADGLPPVSVDTFYPEVARLTLEHGAQIINDVTGFDSAEMRALAAEFGCGCVVMHHSDVTGCTDAADEIKRFFEMRVEECVRAGIDAQCIALDIGIGFGKTREQEVRLLQGCGLCRVGELPLLVGASRKRVIAYMMDVPDCPPEKRDPMTHRAHALAVASGADIIRVHDVSGAVSSLRG